MNSIKNKEYDSFRLFFNGEIIENIRYEIIFNYESKLKEKMVFHGTKNYLLLILMLIIIKS